MGQPVTFLGNGLVFHPTKNRVLCRFVNGEYTTEDPDEIEILSMVHERKDMGEVIEDPDGEEPKRRRGRPRNGA